MNSPITKPSPLGRGLSALFGDSDSSYQPKPATNATISEMPPIRAAHTQAGIPISKAAEAKKDDAKKDDETKNANNLGGIRTMPVGWLQPGAFQPRRHFDEEALKGLAGSISERGILEPLLVRPVIGQKDAYEIIAGERRWRASQLAGLHDVPVVVRELSDRESLEFGLIENVQRQDLSPLEEAEGYNRLMQEFSHTQDNLAKIVGKSRPHITNMLRLLTLPEQVKQMVDNGALTIGHARAVLTAHDPVGLAEEIVRRGLNVRQAEALGQQHTSRAKVSKKKPAAEPSADTALLEKELERVIGLKVKIETKGKAGTLTLHFHDLDQLDDIIKRLRG
jgi:ParB family chromosome partitioning protein